MPPALRILAIVPEPIDASSSPAAASVWRAVETSMRPAVAGGAIEIVRLSPATGNALEGRLSADSFNIVHVVGRGTSRPSARYGTLTVEGSDRRARDLNAHNFASMCARATDLELIVLQTVGDPPNALDVLRDTLVQDAASVVSITGGETINGSPGSAEFVKALYAGLAAGQPIEAAFARAAEQSGTRVTAENGRGSLAGVRLHIRPQPATTHSGSPRMPAAITVPLPVAIPEVPEPLPSPLALDFNAQEIVRKRKAGAFDVFLCHHVDDKPAVLDVARGLLARGVLPWLDQWELRPGIRWQQLLEEQIAQIQAAAVIVGNTGFGPWQRQEIDAFMGEFNSRGCPVIPVMLSVAKKELTLPMFLRGMTWVDFRASDPEPFSALIWGITGKRPGDAPPSIR